MMKESAKSRIMQMRMARIIVILIRMSDIIGLARLLLMAMTPHA